MKPCESCRYAQNHLGNLAWVVHIRQVISFLYNDNNNNNGNNDNHNDNDSNNDNNNNNNEMMCVIVVLRPGAT